MAVGVERNAGGLAVQAIGSRVMIARFPFRMGTKDMDTGRIQDAPHLEISIDDVEEFIVKLIACAWDCKKRSPHLEELPLI